jgi:hypothetical protein
MRSPRRSRSRSLSRGGGVKAEVGSLSGGKDEPVGAKVAEEFQTRLSRSCPDKVRWRTGPEGPGCALTHLA